MRVGPIRWFSFFLMLLLVFVVTASVAPSKNRREKRAGEQKLAKLVRVNPDYIGIGNSMLRSRINPRVFKKTSGKKIFLLAPGGSVSSAWYLLLKNFVVEANHRRGPSYKGKRILVFFRGARLTKPLEFFRTPRNMTQALRFSNGYEPVYDSIVLKAGGYRVLMQRLVDRYYPIDAVDANWTEVLQEVSVFPLGLAGIDARERLAEVNSVFADDRLKHTTQTLGQNDTAQPKKFTFSDMASNFERHVQESFLPEMIKLGKENDLDLVFVRVRRRPSRASGRAHPNKAALEKYIGVLKNYIHRQGFTLIDLSNEKRISRRMFEGGDHIARKYKSIYTKLFVQILAKHGK